MGLIKFLPSALRLAIAALALGWIATCSAASANLSKTYQDWLSGPTGYLITKTEKEAFRNLKSDPERDAFIERFWEVRNPAPSSGQNEFKEEFYRRVAWANAHYANDTGGDGWRSDRGRTYILFGRPQSVSNFLFDQQLYPIELWFFANPGLTELPPFFYVLFYDKDAVGGYRFYHPVVDSPDKLVRSGYSKEQAYRYLRNISPELARASLTLIPGEPVDTDTYSGSMDSARILQAIQGYPDMKSYVATIQEKSRRLQRVTTNIHFDMARSNMLTFVSVSDMRTDPRQWLHYQVEVNDPSQPKAAAGRVQYQIRTQLTSGGQLVLERTDSPSFTVPEAGQEALKPRPFVFEDRLPIVPGKYRLNVTVTNKAATKSYDSSSEFTVEAPGSELAISDVLVVPRREPDTRSRPFQFGGVKFFPSSSRQVLAAGALGALNVLFQVSSRSTQGQVPLEYVIGAVASKVRKTFEDKLDLQKADAQGSLFTAKQLSLEGIPPGSYQLVVRLTDPATGKITARSTSFSVVSGDEEKSPILISQARPETAGGQAATAYERALCWLSQGREREAVSALEVSWNLSQNPALKPLLDHLREHSQNNGNAKNARGITSQITDKEKH